MSLFEYDEKKHERTMMEIGREEGYAEGDAHRLLTLIIKKVKKQKNLEQIADELEEDIDVVQPLYECVLRYAPQYNMTDIMDEVMNKKIK